MKSNLKTSAALRVGDTAFLRNEPMEKFIEQVASPIMDEQDEIESLKAQIRARNAAQLKLNPKPEAVNPRRNPGSLR